MTLICFMARPGGVSIECLRRLWYVSIHSFTLYHAEGIIDLFKTSGRSLRQCCVKYELALLCLES
jgi:hypothetical protein